MNSTLATMLVAALEPLGDAACSPDTAASANAPGAVAVGLLRALDTLPDVVLLIDIDERITYCNHALSSRLDQEPADIMGRPVGDLAWEWVSSATDDTSVAASPPLQSEWPWQRVLANLPANTSTMLGLNTETKRRHLFGVAASPLRDGSGQVLAALLVLHDMTVIRRRQDSQEKALDILRRSAGELQSKNEELYRLATIDPLTKVYNRRAFFEAFEAHFQAAKTDKTALACMMVDIDYFKSVNDTFGHALGDVIIQHLATVLTRFSGDDGIVGRLGGEEFCLLKPGMTEPQAMELAEELREFLESGRDSSYADQLGVTASFGVSALPTNVQSTHQLVELADQALYLAKEQGRNRVVGYQTASDIKAQEQLEAMAALEEEPAADEPVGEVSGHQPRRRDDTSRDNGARVIVEQQSDAIERQLLIENIEQSLQHTGTREDLVAIVVFDSSSVDAIAERLEHGIGARLITAVINRIGNLLRSRDVVSQASFGSDDTERPTANEHHQIAVLVSDIDRLDSVSVIVERMLTVFDKPIVIDGIEYALDTFAGVSVSGMDGKKATELLENACTACGDARAAGAVNGYRFFCRTMDSESLRQRQLQADLYQAMERQELSIVYQPRFDLSSESILGFEALLRWQHPELGNIAPAEFIPLAERTGYIKSLTHWVLRAVVQQLSLWQQDALAVKPVAINVSAGELLDVRLAETLVSIMDAHEVSAELIEIEISESIGIEAQARVQVTLELLRERGFAIAIDDAGTGYAALDYLQQLPVDRLKIDRCYVGRLTSDPDAQRIVRAIVSLGGSLGIKVLSQGVENTDQLQSLLAERCDEVQGFLLGKPVDAGKATALLNDESALAELVAHTRTLLASTESPDASPADTLVKSPAGLPVDAPAESPGSDDGQATGT